MAGLNVGGSIFEGAGKWLDLVKSGPHDCNFSYQANTGISPTMTSVGLLLPAISAHQARRPHDGRWH